MSVIQVKGNVTYPITIDPSVWIFDDRKFSFDRKGDSQDTYLQSAGDESHLDPERVIREGRIAPPTLKTEKQYEKQKLMNGSFAMRLGTVLKMLSRTALRHNVYLSQVRERPPFLWKPL